MRREHLPLVFLILAVLACNLPPGIPVTPTIAPTLIPTTSPTPTAIALLPTDSPTPSFTPSVTDTPTETELPSETPLSSSTNTPQPSATLTPTPSDTFTSTPIPSDTASATLTNTPQPTTTGTPTETATPLPSYTPQPTETPLPTLTPIPSSATPFPVLTDTPTFTLVPSPTLVELSVSTVTQAPTLISFVATLVPSPTIVPLNPSPLPPPSPTFSGGPVVIAPLGGGTSVAGLPTPTALVLGGGAGPNALATIPLLVQSSVITARNADRNKQGILAAVDPAGHLSIDGKPVMPNISRKESLITLVRWSPDGRWLAFVAEVPNAPSDPANSTRIIDDGLWVLDTQSGETSFVLRQKYDNPYDSPQVRLIDDVMWGPDNDVMLVTLGRHNPGQFVSVKASIVVGLGAALAQNKTNPKYANQAESFPVIPYLGGSWLDNQRFVAVSSIPGQAAQLGIYKYSDNSFTPIADGAALHLWMQSPTQLPDGRFAFLGRPAPTGRQEENPQTPLRLYVLTPGGSPIAASGEMPGPVLLADWDATRSMLTVYVQEGSSVVRVDLQP